MLTNRVINIELRWWLTIFAQTITQMRQKYHTIKRYPPRPDTSSAQLQAASSQIPEAGYHRYNLSGTIVNRDFMVVHPVYFLALSLEKERHISRDVVASCIL